MDRVKISRIVWEDVKRSIIESRLVDSVRWWFSKRKIRSLTKQLEAPPQLLTRRGFFGTPLLLLLPAGPAPLPPHVIKERIIAEFLNTREGRMRLAQSMIQPLRRRLDYAAIARKVFLVQQLPEGAQVYYGRDTDV